jgi:bacterioferritin-associated ferredoxin
MTVSLFRDASEGAEMPIVCSCNVFSDHQVRSVVAKEARRPRMNEVYAGLGCSAQCGRCAHTIKRIIRLRSCCGWSLGRRSTSQNTPPQLEQKQNRTLRPLFAFRENREKPLPGKVT